MNLESEEFIICIKVRVLLVPYQFQVVNAHQFYSIVSFLHQSLFWTDNGQVAVNVGVRVNESGGSNSGLPGVLIVLIAMF